MRCWVIDKKDVNNSNINSKPSDILKLREDIILPEIDENECLVKIKSAGLNFNSVWSSKLYPADPFSLMNGHVRRNKNDAKHVQNYFIPGSDACGEIVKIKNSENFKEGDEVIIHCAVIADEDLSTKDPMLSKSQSIWGYETNFGSFAEYSIVKNSQLISKPKNLNLFAAGSSLLTLGTAYRMIVSENGGQLKKGETCLIWGASGGLGVFAIQLVKYLGGVPICIVSNKEKLQFCKNLGADKIICLSELENKNFLNTENQFNIKLWLEFSRKIKDLTGEDKVDMVFEHIGKETIALSLYLLRRGGRVVTCAATSGFIANIDLRYVWMEMKKLIGSHFCNPREAMESVTLLEKGYIKNSPSLIMDFNEIPKGLNLIDKRQAIGKIAIKF